MAFDAKQLKVDTSGVRPQKPLTPEQQKAAEEKATLQEERLYQRGTVTIRDLIAPSAFEVKPDFLQIGNKYARTLFVVTYPRYVGIGWGAPIINYNSTLDVGMFFYPVKSEVILKQLKNKDKK